MTAPTGVNSGVGFRNCIVYALNAAGRPLGNSATVPYEGIRLSGAKTLTITDPEPRKITTPGDDTIIAIDALPPTEAMTAELHTGKVNDLVDALLGAQKVFAVGEMELFGEGTDKRGFEVQVGMLAYRQSLDTDLVSTNGTRAWASRILPKATLYSRDTGFSDQPEDHVYTVIPAKCGSHLWGPAFTEAIEGLTQAQMLRGLSWGKPWIASFIGSGTSAQVCAFSTSKQATATTKIAVFVDGVAVTSGITKAVTGVTFATGPATTSDICIVYETA